MKYHLNKNGFTLIELLVVVAIIGILAAVGVVAYSGYTAGAKKQTMASNQKMIQKYAMAEILKCQSGIDLTEGPDSSKHIKTCSTGGAGNLDSNVWAQYFINVFESKIINPYKTTPSNPDGLLNSGPTRNAGEIVLVGWNKCDISPCFLIDAAYDDKGTKKSLDPMLQVPTGF